MEHKDLSPAEMFVLNIVYELDGGDANLILRKVRVEKAWNRTTLLTVLSRLAVKGYLVISKEGRKNIYYPSQPRMHVFTKIFKYIFGKAFVDNPNPLVSYLMYLDEMRPSDKKILRKIQEDIEVEKS